MAGSIPQDFIREIVDTTDIVSLIDGYLPLKRKGKDHWGISVSYTHLTLPTICSV